jgi:hypothetical protein
MSRGDVHILRGLDAILNPEHIAPNTNFREIERQMINDGVLAPRVKEPEDKFNEDLVEAAQKIGLSLDDIPLDKATIRNITGRAGASQQYGQPARQSFTPAPARQSQGPAPAGRPAYPADDGSSSESSDSDEQPSARPPPVQTSYASPRPTSYSQHFEDKDLETRTVEQQRRSHIDTVIGSSNQGGIPLFEAEKREDKKCEMLADIDSHMSLLSGMGVDTTRWATVDKDTDYASVESMHKFLSYKYDKARYSSFAEELIMLGAYTLEDLFDGKRMWFGKCPNMKGYHNQARIKLRRVRNDTAQIVSATMQSIDGVGPLIRLLIEFIPNMFIYSHVRSEQYEEPDAITEDDVAMARSRTHSD